MPQQAQKTKTKLLFLKFKGPYHIGVCLYSVLHNTGVVSHRALVPAAVQTDQGATSIVTRKSAVCNLKESFTQTLDKVQIP